MVSPGEPLWFDDAPCRYGLDFLQAPLEDLERTILDPTIQPGSTLAELAAAAIIQAESSEAGHQMYGRVRDRVEKALARPQRGEGYNFPNGYLLDVAAPDVADGFPALAHLILVSRGAALLARGDLPRPYKLGAFARHAAASRQDVDDTVVSFLGLNAQYRTLQDALKTYTGQSHNRMVERVKTGDNRWVSVQLAFNANAPQVDLLAQIDIVRELGLYDGLSPMVDDPIRDGQFRQLIASAAAARRGGGKEFYSLMPVWQVTAVEDFLSDREKCLGGNQAVANIRSRRWRYLSGYRAQESYFDYLRTRETRVSELNSKYYELALQSPDEVRTELNLALQNYDAERAANVWTVITQRRHEPAFKRLATGYQHHVSVLVEADVLDCADRVGFGWRMPRYVATLLADNYFALRGKVRQHTRPYPSVLSNDYGSLSQDYQRIGAALSRMVGSFGGEYPIGSDLLDMTVAYALVDRAAPGMSAEQISSWERAVAVCIANWQHPALGTAQLHVGVSDLFQDQIPKYLEARAWEK